MADAAVRKIIHIDMDAFHDSMEQRGRASEVRSALPPGTGGPEAALPMFADEAAA